MVEGQRIEVPGGDARKRAVRRMAGSAMGRQRCIVIADRKCAARRVDPIRVMKRVAVGAGSILPLVEGVHFAAPGGSLQSMAVAARVDWPRLDPAGRLLRTIHTVALSAAELLMSRGGCFPTYGRLGEPKQRYEKH